MQQSTDDSNHLFCMKTLRTLKHRKGSDYNRSFVWLWNTVCTGTSIVSIFQKKNVIKNIEEKNVDSVCDIKLSSKSNFSKISLQQTCSLYNKSYLVTWWLWDQTFTSILNSILPSLIVKVHWEIFTKNCFVSWNNFTIYSETLEATKSFQFRQLSWQC